MTDTATPQQQTTEGRAVNAIRALTLDATTAAGSGHPGMPLGAAPMGYLLYTRFMTHDPAEPTWWNRDRYVQSAGHGSMLQYALLHLTGYELPMDELKRHRQWGSMTPGHPEVHHTPGVETTTGPLGQGFATAVGMALAEAHLAARYNRSGYDVIDHFTYVVASDGDLMEGVSAEASSLAGHLGLGKLIVLYDDNLVSLDGPTDLSFSEDVLGRYDAYGWHTQRLADGNDLNAIAEAIEAARNEAQRPSLIAVRTVIGFGAPGQGGSGVHGSALSDDELAATREALGIDWEPFTVPDDVLVHYRETTTAGAAARERWQGLWNAYRDAHPEAAAELERVMTGALPTGFAEVLPRFAPGDKLATRKASQRVVAALAPVVPELLGGAADLSGSNYTTIEDGGVIQRGDYGGRNVYYGVREHAMAAMANGLALHGGVRPFVGTFLIFSDYLRPALRLGALMESRVIYVLTHDSIGLGGDGPTHQPVAALMALRAIPNVTVLRPADANETAQAWAAALEASGPAVLALSRQNLPTLEVPAGSVARGGYVLADAPGGEPEVILIGTGSEVALCLEARDALAADGVGARVVSMPSFELFDAQDAAYRAAVLPPALRARVAVEAGATLGWERYVGLDGMVIGLDRFGASGDGDEVMRELGFTVDAVVDAARKVKG